MELTYTEEDCREGVRRHAAKSAWARIGQGLYFLKAHALHARGRGQPKKNCPTVGQFSVEDRQTPPQGFLNFLVDAFNDIPFMAVSRTTAFSYMQAARKLGLTADSTEADLEALQSGNALQGRTMRELYLLDSGTDEEKAARQNAPGTEADTLEQGLFTFMKTEFSVKFAEQSKHLKVLAAQPLRKVQAVRDQLDAAIRQVDRILDIKAGKGGRR